MLVQTQDTKIHTATATVDFNQILSNFSIDSTTKRHSAIDDLEIPALSSILKITPTLNDSFNVTAGGQNRTKVRVYNGSTDFLKMNTSHKRNIFEMRNLYKEPVYTGDSAFDINVELECFLDGVWSKQDYSLTGVRSQTFGTGATPDASIVMGGLDEGLAGLNTAIESDGASWSSAAGTMAVALRLSGCCGTYHNALYAGGIPPSAAKTLSAYKYNGTSHSSTGNMAIKRKGNALVGTSSAAFITGGDDRSTYSLAESFNGSTWATESNVYPIGAGRPRAVGTSTNALITGGAVDTLTVDFVYEWNGVIFVLDSILNVKRFSHGMTGSYSSGFSAITFAGHTGDVLTGASINTTESYENLTWRIVAPSLVKNSGMMFGGTHTNAISAGGVSGFVTPEVYEVTGGSAANLNTLESGSLTLTIDYITYG